MVRLRDLRVLARVQLMADFGEAILDCQGQVPRSSARVLPTLAPGCASDYEVWTTQASVGDGRFQAAGISFGVDNPTTVIDPAEPSRLVFNDVSVCGPGDPAGTESRCKGDRRWIQHPRWVVRNAGPPVFYTDVYGRGYSTKAFPGSVRQYVANDVSVDERRYWAGPSTEFRMSRPTDGGIFRPRQRAPSQGFDTTGSVRWPN